MKDAISIQSHHATIGGYLPPAFTVYYNLNQAIRVSELNGNILFSHPVAYEPPLKDGGTRRYFLDGKEYVMQSWDKESGTMTFISGSRNSETVAPKKGKLLVLLENGWEYVFCRNESINRPVVTADASKALNGDALEYFERQFPSLAFTVSK